MGRTIAVIGCGAMGSAIVAGLISAGKSKPENITVSLPKKDAADELATKYGVHATTDNADAAKGKDIVLLAVKPQIMAKVLQQMDNVIEDNQLIISIAAGISIDTIQEHVGQAPVVRSMPNLAVTVSMGATGISGGPHASADDLATARAIFESVGMVEEVPEYLLDAVTGLSGTGPMYVFYMIEALSDAGVKVGLSRATSTRLALQTVRGAGKLAEEAKMHPAALKDLVSSPGGTSITALHILRQQGYAAILMDAVEAATNRSKELGE